MIMDADLEGYYASASGVEYIERGVSPFPDCRNYISVVPAQPDATSNVANPPFESDPHEDCDFSDFVLKYISEILMEEDMEEKSCMFQESAALQAAEKSFYEVLGKKYPPETDHSLMPYLKENFECPEDSDTGNCSISGTNSSMSDELCPDWNPISSKREAAEDASVLVASQSNSQMKKDATVELRPDCNPDLCEYGSGDRLSVGMTSQSRSQASYNSLNSHGNVFEGSINSPVSTLSIPDIFSDSQSMLQFRKGVEEASKFLPAGNGSLLNTWPIGLLGKMQVEGSKGTEIKAEKYNIELSPDNSRGKKNPYLHYDLDVQGERKYKQSAFSAESTMRSEMFDMVLLCSGGKNESAVREALQNGKDKNTLQDEDSKVLSGRKSRGKKKGGRRNAVDLRTLLTLCAQAVAADDRRTAIEFLKQIREHSDPTGDGMQRLAHYFADGLEARMAGAGTQVYKALVNLPTSAADILKAYQLYLAICPFRKISNFFSNKTIMNVSSKATRVHIIDFGILYGFQWPCFIQRLSSRPNGPPKLRITGVDLPCPGFRPAERVEETGRRLAHYAETFNVPFEFNAIAQKWETIKIEDLKLEEGEVVVVSSLYRFRNLLDETVIIDSPRTAVLNLIKKINPAVFVQGIVNGAYSAPFFITRFREALFHYSSLFDMLEANVPRETHERMLIEKTIFAREAQNVIACEAAERIERPETYRQWQVRIIRAGFKQLPLNKEIMEMATHRVRMSYHKDFVIDEDGHWLLLGWKGRIVYGLSSWKSAAN
ncbi:hypothetical protein LIER_30610 [Lithospermum erythrorhizon]|uniref:Scarecrow-like protein 9 n=1 Tax=Lithospermum erythrorhizon TaxID=34254 RepID=A0AAV3RPA3_LITER